MAKYGMTIIARDVYLPVAGQRFCVLAVDAGYTRISERATSPAVIAKLRMR